MDTTTTTSNTTNNYTELNDAVNAVFEKQVETRVANAMHTMVGTLFKYKCILPELTQQYIINLLTENGQTVKKMKKPKQPAEPKLILPYIPIVQNGCISILKANGLYTQCTKNCVENTSFCKNCTTTMTKNNTSTPEFGTIHDRMKVGVMDYTDKKGDKPVPFQKINKFTKEEIVNAVRQKGINPATIPEVHFEPYDPPKKPRGKTKTAAAATAASSETPAAQHIEDAEQEAEEEEEVNSSFELVEIDGTKYLMHVDTHVAYAFTDDMHAEDGSVADKYLSEEDGDYDVNKLKRVGVITVIDENTHTIKLDAAAAPPAKKTQAKKK